MEFFNSNIRLEYIKSELKKSRIEYSIEFDEIYSSTRVKLKRALNLHSNQNFDLPPSDLNNIQSALDTAKEFTSLLPAHTCKVYKQLLECEEYSLKTKSFFVLDKPIVHLLDIGCGGGSVSIALLMLLSNYQKFRLERKLLIYPVCVNLLGIDPNPHAITIYSCFIAEAEKAISKSLLKVKFEVINGKLSENTPTIFEWLNSYEVINACIFAFGNVIRPYNAEFLGRVELEKPIRKKTKLINRTKYIGDSEIKSINSILEHITIDRAEIIVISSPTKGSKKHPEYENNWLIETKKFLNQANKVFKANSHYSIKKKEIKRQGINIFGPKDCFYRRVRKNRDAIFVEYNAGFLFIESKQYLEIKKEWTSIIDINNLLLAWVRVRNEMANATLEDTLEIRLFEINIQNKLEQLRCRLLSYDFGSLGVDKMINYLVPKGHGKTPRPMSICRLEEQILAVAILQVKSDEYDSLPKYSFAYRISSERGKENLYNDWFPTHQNFIKSARKILEENPDYRVIQTDLSSYYTMIQQDTLLKEFCHLTRLHDKRFIRMAGHLIKRDCGIGSPNKGLPQGHVLSGALSNIYLHSIDLLFENGNEWGIHYFRYVDDMVFIIPNNIDPSTILEKLDIELDKLGLKRSIDKTTEAMTSKKYLELTEVDQELDDLGKKYNFLLADLYKSNRDNYQLLKLDWWKYIDHLQKLLCSIGYFVSVPRLSRKIKQNLRRWEIIKIYISVKTLLPHSKSFDELADIKAWKIKFTTNNSEWIEQCLNIHIQLKKIFREALSVLSESTGDEKSKTRAKKRFKFSINRLGKLGFDELTDTVVDIVIGRPWLVHVRRVCEDLALQGKEDALVKIINDSTPEEEIGFVRACAIKSLQVLSSVNSDILKSKVFNEILTQAENVMLSEAIFLSKTHMDLKSEEFDNLVFRSGLHDAAKRNLSLQIESSNSNNFDLKYDMSINEAIQIKTNFPSQDFEALFSYEPDILREMFYQYSYPDDDSEFPDFPSWI